MVLAWCVCVHVCECACVYECRMDTNMHLNFLCVPAIVWVLLLVCIILWMYAQISVRCSNDLICSNLQIYMNQHSYHCSNHNKLWCDAFQRLLINKFLYAAVMLPIDAHCSLLHTSIFCAPWNDEIKRQWISWRWVFVFESFKFNRFMTTTWLLCNFVQTIPFFSLFLSLHSIHFRQLNGRSKRDNFYL